MAGAAVVVGWRRCAVRLVKTYLEGLEGISREAIAGVLCDGVGDVVQSGDGAGGGGRLDPAASGCCGSCVAGVVLEA